MLRQVRDQRGPKCPFGGGVWGLGLGEWGGGSLREVEKRVRAVDAAAAGSGLELAFVVVVEFVVEVGLAAAAGGSDGGGF